MLQKASDLHLFRLQLFRCYLLLFLLYFSNCSNREVLKYALNPEVYKEKFEPFFKEGKDILYVHFSAAMSGTFNSMQLAYKELKEKYPERNLYEIDTKGITVLSLNIALEVAKLYKDGKSVEEILAWAKEEVDRFTVYFFAEDLKFFRRSGRVSGLAAFFGTLASIKPLMYMGNDGKMATVGKVRGRPAAMNALLQYVEDLGDDLEHHKTIVAHSDAEDVALELEKRLKEKYQDKIDTMVVEINPTIGSHCGPSAVGICFHAKHR